MVIRVYIDIGLGEAYKLNTGEFWRKNSARN